MMASAELEVFALPTPPTPGPIPVPADYSQHSGTETPVIIDNGATNLRYGFASSPAPLASVPNAMAKYKERKTIRPVLLFGDYIEIESAAKANAKYSWEGDVLLSFDSLVLISTPPLNNC
jgi:actin-related protein 5